VTMRAPDGTDKTSPTTVATGATANGWYNHTVTIRLAATDNAGGSGVASITYSVDGGAPVTVKGSSATVTIGADDDDAYVHDSYDHDGDDEDSRDGAHVVAYYATDVAGNAEAAQALRFNIDTHKPTTKAPYSAKAKRYQRATLKYQVNDETPNGGTAKVIIVIKDGRGNVVKMLELGLKPVNTLLAASFNCSLKAGTYTFYVYATDTAGNTQANVAKNTLKVYSGS
jgi:cytochrome c